MSFSRVDDETWIEGKESSDAKQTEKNETITNRQEHIY